MTHPTRQVCGMLLKDYVKVSRGSSEGLYTEKHLEEALQRTQLIDFHQTIEVNGIKVGRLPSQCSTSYQCAELRCIILQKHSSMH